MCNALSLVLSFRLEIGPSPVPSLKRVFGAGEDHFNGATGISNIFILTTVKVPHNSEGLGIEIMTT